MLTAASITLLVVGGLGSLVAHEAAHWRVGTKLGLRYDAAGIGSSRWLVLVCTTKSGLRLTLSPVLVGAYVRVAKSSEADLKAMTHADTARFAGAGPLANLLLGCGFASVLGVAAGKPVFSVAAVAVALALWAARDQLMVWVFPAIGPLLLVTELPAAFYAFAHAPRHGALHGVPWTPTLALLILTAGNVLLAAASLLPILPCDGGHVFLRLARRRFGERGELVFGAGGLVTMWAVEAATLVWLAVQLWP